MIRAFLGVVGLFLLIASVLFWINLQKSEKLAFSLDKKETRFAEMGGDMLLPCSWEVNIPERVITDNRSQAILINTKNLMSSNCESTLSLRAPGFDMNPPLEQQSITLPSKSKGSISWIISPRSAGTYQIAVSDITNSKIFGITVTNMFGLNAIEAKILSILGSLFGPMLTIPWWWEKWFKRKTTFVPQ